MKISDNYTASGIEKWNLLEQSKDTDNTSPKKMKEAIPKLQVQQMPCVHCFLI